MTLVEHLQPDDGTKQQLVRSIADRLAPGGWYLHAGPHGDLTEPSGRRTLAAWKIWLEASGFPPPARESFLHKATVEDSIVGEERLLTIFRDAGFTDVQRIFQSQLLGAWLMRKRAA